MKSFIIFLSVCFSSPLLFGQGIIDDHFRHLKDVKDATQITIDGKLFGFAANFKENDDKDVAEAGEFLSTITGFSAIGIEELSNASAEYEKGLSVLKRGFDELMVIRSKGTNFSLYVNETNGTVHELVGIGHEGVKFGVFTLTGNMDLKKIGKFASEIQMDGFDKMEKIEDYDLTEIKVYPNPVSNDGKVTLDTPRAFEGGQALIINGSGAKVKSYDIDRPSLDISTRNLNPGIYFMEISKDEVSVKRKFIIVD